MSRLFLFVLCTFIIATVKAETTAELKVSAVIERGCTFSDTGATLDYGTHPTSSNNTNVTASIVNNKSTWNLECTPDVPVSITFDNGQNFNTTTQTRNLKSEVGSFFISYQIYSDAARSKVIGTTSPSNTLSLKSTSGNNILNFGVYGHIDLSQGDRPNKPSGKYLDEILITIAW